MELGGSSRSTSQVRKRPRVKGNTESASYGQRLQFYTVPPVENISLQEFEQFAVERLKVLNEIEKVGAKHLKGTANYKKAITDSLINLRRCLTKPVKHWDAEDSRWDYISHFILRLAYCRSEDLKRWFMTQEMDLFRFRFCNEDAESIEDFLRSNNLNYQPISESEKNELRFKLSDSTFDMTTVKVSGTEFYKVPFTDALDIVRARRCYVKDGYAYVPHHDLVSLVLTSYRLHLSHALAVTSRAVPHLEEDDRLLPMLTSLSKRYLGQDYNNKKSTTGEVTADMVNGLSEKHFPLCMRQMQDHLKQEHHLKHGGRQQYGLFLKAIGMSLDEAMRFWKMSFAKNIDADKFDKQYSYNIRHNYGKEGKRADYTPYSCMKIIMSNAPAAGDAHGCPFKHSDIDMLRQRLQNLRVNKDGIDEISDFVKRGHYQLACGKYFEVTHPKHDLVDFSPNHPNQYYEESVRIESGVSKEGSTETPKSQRSKSFLPIKATPNTPSTQCSTQPSTQDESFDDIILSAEDMDKALEGVESC
ncbi:unnamed protein product [Owenia fusiformis]|uniref:DNA primase large subunit n=1 Tax=Owenia fusiformis TaxID=6347 RepID=A0A8S4N1E2_OWEFU|nr:unnamed protein product [Owenia fusiformis]